MDDQLDNDLKNRIWDVFDNYEDASADEGWLLLREKYPEKANRRAIAWFWWGSVAALLLLFVGIWWLNNKPVVKQNMASNKQGPIKYQTQKVAGAKKDSPKAAINKPGSAIDSSAIDNQQGQSVASNGTHTGQLLKQTQGKTNHQPLVPSVKEQNIANNAAHSDHLPKHAQGKTNHQPLVPSVKDQNITNESDQKNIASNDISKTGNKANQLAATPHPKPTDEVIDADKIDNNTKTDNNMKPAAKSSTAVATTPGVNMQEQVKKSNKVLFADDEVKKDKKSKKADNEKAVRFGIYAATYFNYAKGSNSQLNLGAGVSSDIKLSKNLGLSTGVSIAQNTLSYNSQPPVASPPLAAASVNYYALMGQNVYSPATSTLKNYNASLVGLDVPVNLKYEFNPEKSPTYVSIGLSSGTFIDETYTSSYNYSLPNVSSVSQTTGQSSHESFNSFYFAKTLNFSFGTGYSLGLNKLIIEPFLKYPLEGLGTQQIKFGAGGVNLKFSFNTKKK